MESWVFTADDMAATSKTRWERRAASSRLGPGLLLSALSVILLLTAGPLRAQTDFPVLGQNAEPSQFQISTEQTRQWSDGLGGQEPTLQLREPNALSSELAIAPNETTGPSAVELLLSGRVPNDVSIDLKQFGYDVFGRAPSTFAPVTNVPVGPDYIIGPGDSFTVTLWGQNDGRYRLTVDRNGQVVMPQVGVLQVWGMRFAELEDYLQQEVSRKFPNLRMSVTMERLRTITVYVVGEAVAPSSYTVSSLSTAINALFAAGGPSKNGTLRNITLRRTGAEPNRIDLYDFLLSGDKSSDVRLQDGDTIFIPLIGPVVAVAGNVKRPAIYEMVDGMSLRDVLDLAGGVTSAGWLQRVQVSRIENHQRRIVVDFDLSSDTSQASLEATLATRIHDGDVVKVFSVSGREQNVVNLAGHVTRPGIYEFKPGMRLRDIIPSYDALLPQVSLVYGQIERLIPPDFHQTTIPFNPGKLLEGDESENLTLNRYDTVRLYRWDERTSQAVRVSGMIFEPNEYRLTSGMRVADLVNAAGGLQKNAYLRTAEITRRHINQDGMTTEKIEIDLAAALAGDVEANILLRDYDYLVVRPIPELEFDRTAEIAGQVRFPGVYPVRKGERLSSLIERAGGFTGNAYLNGAVFTRESAREVQRRRLNEMVRQVEESALATSEQTLSGTTDGDTAESQQVSLDVKEQLLARLRSAEITGRVVIKLTPLEQFRDSTYDLELEPGDTLAVPEMPSVVYVVGEVFNPTALLYEKGGTVNYYLRKVGGMTRDADKKQVSVIKADGSVVSKQQGRGGQSIFWDNEFNQWIFGGFSSRQLQPGDTIVVPRKLDRNLWIRNTKDITQIVFQIAVAAGVVFAI